VSVPQIAGKHGVKVSTLYAALNGTRPAKGATVKRAMAEMHRIAAEELPRE
jgi:hypothetical protein